METTEKSPSPTPNNTRYAVTLPLDALESADIKEAVSAAESPLSEVGAMPHVSLAVFDEVDTDRLLPVVEAFANQIPLFSVRLSAVGMFPGNRNIVVLLVSPSERLMKLHRNLHERLAEAGLHPDDYYSPQAWVPHCTICMDLPLEKSLTVLKAIKICQIYGVYNVLELKVVAFRTAGHIATFPLRGDEGMCQALL